MKTADARSDFKELGKRKKEVTAQAFLPRSAALEFSRGFKLLVITQTYTQSAYVVPQPANAGGRIEPEVERSGTPGTTEVFHPSPRSGRQRLAQSQ